jgi:penicillin-binding protein 1A
VAVKILDLITPKTSYDFLTNKYHMSTLVEQDRDYAPLALGGMTNGVTNRDMAAAYAAIANNVIYNKPKTYTKVCDSTGEVLLDNTTATSEIILSEDTCAVMTKLLQEVVSSGTGRKVTLRNKIDCAGKTGTTQSYNDLYFCGYTPYYTAACWVGYDIAKTLKNFSSGQTAVSPAMYLWDQVMTSIHEPIIASGKVKKFSEDLTKNLITKTFCKDSGLLVGSNCGADLRGKRTATGYYTTSNLPSGSCKVHTMVSYCTVTNCVAGPGCTSVKNVALLNYQRKFLTKVKIADAQYTYVPVPEGTLYEANPGKPFYGKLYPPTLYPGYTNTSKQANAYCAAHNPTLCQ